MRLLTRKLWRAFPELDRFTDEQCRNFVRAAESRRLRRLARSVACLALGFVVFLGLTVGVQFLLLWLYGPNRIGQPGIDAEKRFDVLVLSIIVALPLAFFLSLFLRDLLLRHGIRRVIDRRGRCGACGYVLLGLRVGDDLKLTCPECGAVSEVDPALNELVVDGTGAASFQPTIRFVDPIVAARVAARRKRILKWSARISGALLVVVGAWLGLRENRLRDQAARAAAGRNAPQALQSVAEAGFTPEDLRDYPDRWNDFVEALMERSAAVTAAVSALEPATRTPGAFLREPDFSLLYVAESELQFSDPEVIAADRLAAHRVLTELRSSGGLDCLRPLVDIRVAVRPVLIPPGECSLHVMLPELSWSRRTARMNGARMEFAVESGDRQEFVNAFEEILAIARILSHQPLVIDRLVSLAIQRLATSRLDRLLPRVPEAWLSDLDAAMQRQVIDFSPLRTIDGDLEAARDAVRWIFEDRWAIGERLDTLELVEGVTLVRTGTFDETLQQLEAIGQYWRTFAQLPHTARAAAAPPPGVARAPGGASEIAPTVLTHLDRLIEQCGAGEVNWRGARLLIALEQVRRTTGAYPTTLDGLPAAAVLLDPYTNLPFRLRFINPETDPAGRPFVLYSVGPDLTDDGGGWPFKWGVVGPNALSDTVVNGF